MHRLTRLTPLQLAMLPALALLAVLFLYPLLRVALLGLHAPQWSLAEFARVFTSSNVAVLLKTFGISALVTALCLAIGYPMAAYLNQLRGTAQKLAMLCVVLPFLTSLLVRSYGWVVLLGDNGAINSLLLARHVVDEPLTMLYSRFGMLVGMVHVMLPFMILPIYSAMRRVDPAQWRSARALGAGALRAFLTVYLPQTTGGVRSGCMLVAIISLGFYVTPAMLGDARDVMLSNLIANNVLVTLDFPLAAAFALVLLAATLVIYAALGGGTMSAEAPTVKRAAGGAAAGIARFGPVARMNAVLSAMSGRARAARIGQAAGASRIGGRPVLLAYGAAVCVYLLLPSVIVLVGSFSGDSTLAFPPRTWSLRWYELLMSDPQWRSAGWTSLRIAFASTLVAVALGALAAYGIARSGGRRGAKLALALILAPMIVPPVVTALGAFTVLTQFGLYGKELGIVLMHACLNIPLVVVVLVGALGGFDWQLERAATSLGASRLRTARKVILPLLAPAVLSAALFAFIHSFDEIVLTSFIVGSDTVTLPTKMWENIRNQVDPTIAALSSLLVLVPLLAVVAMGVSERMRQARASASAAVNAVPGAA